MTTTDEPPVQEGRQQSPFTRPRFLIAAGAIVLVLVMFVWLLANPAEPELAQPAPNGGPAAALPVSDSMCGLPVGSQQVPETTPASGVWRTLPGGMAAPSDPDIGPGRVMPVTTSTGTVELMVCYAPSPMGALYAAANFVAVNGHPHARLAAAQQLTMPGIGQDAAIDDLTANPGGNTSGVQVRAFDFLSYDPGDSAVIDLVLTTGNGGLARVPLSLIWHEGDWKVQLPENGSPFAARQPLASDDGYVTFSGV